ncbi:MAG: PH domain-containing protein [Gemmatimonadales bacterium]|nr:PH domain-containing protein [Gemmatimonadales bacterium]
MASPEQELLPGERLVHVARLHWAVFLPGVLTELTGGALTVGLALTAGFPALLGGVALMLVGTALLVPPLLRRNTTWIAVTDQRLIARRGIVGRATVDTQLARIDGINVEQGAWDRLLGRGNATVSGAGLRERFEAIGDPEALRRAVQGQIAAGRTLR